MSTFLEEEHTKLSIGVEMDASEPDLTDKESDWNESESHDVPKAYKRRSDDSVSRTASPQNSKKRNSNFHDTSTSPEHRPSSSHSPNKKRKCAHQSPSLERLSSHVSSNENHAQKQFDQIFKDLERKEEKKNTSDIPRVEMDAYRDSVITLFDCEKKRVSEINKKKIHRKKRLTPDKRRRLNKQIEIRVPADINFQKLFNEWHDKEFIEGYGDRTDLFKDIDS